MANSESSDYPELLSAPLDRTSCPARRGPRPLPAPSATPCHWLSAPSLGLSSEGREELRPLRMVRGSDIPGRWGWTGLGRPHCPSKWVGVWTSPSVGPRSPPPGGEESVALGPRGRGGAGQRGRHEDSGFRHVLRVPHARSVTPAPHVRPTTLVTTFAACPSWPPHPPRPAARCWRPQGDVGGRVPLPGSRAAEPVA